MTTIERQAPPPLQSHVLTVAAIVVLGAIMTVLDATIVSVAIDTLAEDFGSPLATGWAVDRFGGKRVWL
jgi:hypothetical protein